MMMRAILAAWAQGAPGQPDIPSLAYWGVAGVLLAFVLWLFVDRDRSYKALLTKMLSDVLPALVASTEELKQSRTHSERMLNLTNDIMAKPNLDPILFNQMTRVLHSVDERLRKEV